MADDKPTTGPSPLADENAKLRSELAALKAQTGLPVGAITVSRGQKIHYVRGDERVCRPATGESQARRWRRPMVSTRPSWIPGSRCTCRISPRRAGAGRLASRR